MVKQRDSNFELFRILLMLVIIMHHLIEASGLNANIVENFMSSLHRGLYDCVVLLMWWGGKTAINCFVLITGWYMSTNSLDIKWCKILKLYFETKFYAIIIYIIFLISGYASFSIRDLYKTLFCIELNIGKEFISSFLAFYTLIPFLNRLIKELNKKSHFMLVCVLLFIFCFIPTLFINNSFEYIGWYVTLYFVASFIRLYRSKYFDNICFTGCFALGSVFIACSSIGVIYLLSIYTGKCLHWDWFLVDSNKILAFTTAVFSFCFFKNLNLGQNRIINIIASTTFGILLIHTSSDIMKRWLWGDLCNVLWHYENDSLVGFIGYSILCVICVFISCGFIDLLRQQLQLLVENIFLRIKTKRGI